MRFGIASVLPQSGVRIGQPCYSLQCPMTTWEQQALEAAARRQVQVELAVRNAIADEEKKNKKKDFGLWKHPLFLLFAGTMLTAGLGSWFATRWQLQQWQIQQLQQAQVQEAKDMRDLQIETAKAISTTFIAAEDVVQFYDWPNVNVKERAKGWEVASREWRVTERVLLARVRSKFGGGVEKLFVKLSADRKYLGANIQNLIELAETKRRRSLSRAEREQVKKFNENARERINKAMKPSGDLARLMKSMEFQIQRRERERIESSPMISRWIL